MKIVGIPVGNTMPRTNWEQTDPTKADYLKGREILDQRIEAAQTAAGNAQAAAGNAKTAADNAQNTANAALPRAGGDMAGDIAMGGKKVTGLADPSMYTDAATKGYVDGRKAALSVVLTTAWSNKTQTVAATGVTADNYVLVTPAPESFVDWSEAAVRCTAQSDGQLTFACEEVPTKALTANILIMN